jgi:hypothetical protein
LGEPGSPATQAWLNLKTRPSIGLSSLTGWMDFDVYMKAIPAEQVKARRTLILLYALMIVGVGLPFVLVYFLR